MIDRKNSGKALAAALLLALAPSVQAEDESHFSLTSGLDYSTGKYGTTSSTEVWFVPVTLKYETGPSTYKLTVPYLRVTGLSGGTIIGYDDGRPIYASGTGARTTEEGLGDVVLGYTRNVIAQPRGGFLVDVGAKVKLPTADERKGLGTGKADYSLYTDVYYPMGAATPFATLGYRVQGDPVGEDLRNVWNATLGLAYKLSSQNSVGAMWDVRQASLAGSDGMNELTAYWVHRLGESLKLQTYGVVGFSDASPDYGLGVMVSFTD